MLQNENGAAAPLTTRSYETYFFVVFFTAFFGVAHFFVLQAISASVCEM